MSSIALTRQLTAAGERGIALSVTSEELLAAITGEAFRPSPSWTEHRDELELLIQHLRVSFSFASGDVSVFLRRNSDVAWLLLGAARALESAFGPSIDVRLSVVLDPDVEHGAPRLFGYIRTSLPLEDALERLNLFDVDWLISHLDIIDGRLGFDLSFSN